MAFYIKVMKNKTLRFNECNCKPFNADFDGDEMNIHVPQTILARSEAKHIMLSQKNLLVPKDGSPIITLMQDFLTCNYLMTSKDSFYTIGEF
jgi:DNA-directed RNA polymerase III subunit RPC1